MQVTGKDLFGEDYVETPCTTQAEVDSKMISYRSLLSGQAMITCLEVLKNLLCAGNKQADWILQAPTLVKVMVGLHYEHYKSALLDQVKRELDYRVSNDALSKDIAQAFMTACEEASDKHVEILATASRMGSVNPELEPTIPAVLVEGTHDFGAGDDSGLSESKLPPMHANKEISPSHVALDEA